MGPAADLLVLEAFSLHAAPADDGVRGALPGLPGGACSRAWGGGGSSLLWAPRPLKGRLAINGRREKTAGGRRGLAVPGSTSVTRQSPSRTFRPKVSERSGWLSRGHSEEAHSFAGSRGLSVPTSVPCVLAGTRRCWHFTCKHLQGARLLKGLSSAALVVSVLLPPATLCHVGR